MVERLVRNDGGTTSLIVPIRRRLPDLYWSNERERISERAAECADDAGEVGRTGKSAPAEAHSAGLEPGTINPLVVQAMEEEGIGLSTKQTPRAFDVWKSGQKFQYVITVCSGAEAKGCPIFPGVTIRFHWPFPDPSQLTGTEEEKLQGVREIRDQIRNKIGEWCEAVCLQRVVEYSEEG